MSRRTVVAACDSRRLHEENQLRFSNSKQFRFYWTKKQLISEWYFTKKTMRLGVLSWENLKHRETHGRIVSLDQLGSRRAIAIFSSCLSPGRVTKLQKFIHFCLKVGHSANLKRSKSTWRQSSCDSCEMYKINTSRNATIYDSCRFDMGRFRAEPTDLPKVSTSEWTFAYRSAHNDLFLTLHVIHKLKMDENKRLADKMESDRREMALAKISDK